MKAKQFTNQESGGGNIPQMPEDNRSRLFLKIVVWSAILITVSAIIYFNLK